MNSLISPHPASRSRFVSRLAVLALLGCAVTLSCKPAFAHHGTAGYDMEKTITLVGTATAFDWSNPHCVIYMDVKRDDGTVLHWVVELASPIHMARAGWTKSSIKPGDQLAADTHPAKSGASVGTSGVQYNVLKIVVNGVALPTL